MGFSTQVSAEAYGFLVLRHRDMIQPIWGIFRLQSELVDSLRRIQTVPDNQLRAEQRGPNY